MSSDSTFLLVLRIFRALKIWGSYCGENVGIGLLSSSALKMEAVYSSETLISTYNIVFYTVFSQQLAA
jgi:hypothetical protein